MTLGVANLRNLGVVAVAEFAIASYQPIIPLAAESSTGLESKYSSDDDDNYRNKNDITDKEEKGAGKHSARKTHMPTTLLFPLQLRQSGHLLPNTH